MIPKCVMYDIHHAQEEEYYVKRFLNYVYGVHAFENKEVVQMINEENIKRREIMNRLKVGDNWIDPLTIIAKTNCNAMMEHMTCNVPTPKKVIYDEAAGVTVVLWMDGTKTIVRAVEGEEHDAYRGYCVALAKKIHGTNSALKRDLEKVLVVKEAKK